MFNNRSLKLSKELNLIATELLDPTFAVGSADGDSFEDRGSYLEYLRSEQTRLLAIVDANYVDGLRTA